MKLSDLSDQQWFERLSGRRAANLGAIRGWWSYYDGAQPMYHVARILAEQDDRFPALTINWAEKYVDSIDARSILEGFGYVGQDSIDDRMQTIFLRNELDQHQSLNNVATLATGCSYAMVGPSAEGALVTIEDARQVAVERDPQTGREIAAIKFWSSDPAAMVGDDMATLLLPNPNGRGSRQVEFHLGKPQGEKKLAWMAGPSKLQAAAEIPVVSFLNRARWGRPQSQIARLKPIIDSANVIATHMMATSHHHAMPRMLALMVSQDLFFNEDGSPKPEALKAATGQLWIVPAAEDESGNVVDGPTPEVKQLPAADMRNFHDTLSLLARVGAGLCNLTPSDLGFGVSENPPSAESINASKHERLLDIERFNRQQGSGMERVMRYSLAVEGADPGPKKLIEAKYRNPGTPTKQSMADAAVKTFSTGISDLYQARLDYGYTPTQIKSMEERERRMARDSFQPPAFRDDPEVTDGGDVADGAAVGESA